MKPRMNLTIRELLAAMKKTKGCKNCDGEGSVIYYPGGYGPCRECNKVKYQEWLNRKDSHHE